MMNAGMKSIGFGYANFINIVETTKRDNKFHWVNVNNISDVEEAGNKTDIYVAGKNSPIRINNSPLEIVNTIDKFQKAEKKEPGSGIKYQIND